MMHSSYCVGVIVTVRDNWCPQSHFCGGCVVVEPWSIPGYRPNDYQNGSYYQNANQSLATSSFTPFISSTPSASHTVKWTFHSEYLAL